MQYYVHHVPGRLRIRIPSLRNNPTRAEEVKALLNVAGTHKIKVNSLTGSVVIHFDRHRVSADNLLDRLKTNGFYREDRTVTLDAKLRQASSKAGRKVSRAMFGWAVGRVLEANGLSLIAAFI